MMGIRGSGPIPVLTLDQAIGTKQRITAVSSYNQLFTEGTLATGI